MPSDILARTCANKTIMRWLIREYGNAGEFVPGFFRVGKLSDGAKEGVYSVTTGDLVLLIQYDEIMKGATDTECVIRMGQCWGVFSLQKREFTYPFDRGATQIIVLPEGPISVTSRVRSLYAVLCEARWSVYNTRNGVTTSIA